MHYVLVAQDRIHVEHFERGDDGRWVLSETDNGEEEVWLRSIDCRLKLSEVYRKLDLLQDKPP